MVVYWSIKSAIDLVGYGLGAKESFQGTGVFKNFKLPKEVEDSPPVDTTMVSPSKTRDADKQTTTSDSSTTTSDRK